MPDAVSETFHALPIASVRAIADAGREIVFDVPTGLVDSFAFKPGQHMMLRVPIDGTLHQRTYSVCASSRGPLRIAVKRVAGGIVSNWLHDHLKAGDSLEVEPPRGRFIVPVGSGGPRHLLMLVAGAGVTPVIGMVTDALEREPATTVTMIFGNRSAGAAMFLAELEDLKDRHTQRFDLMLMYSGAGEADTEMLSGRLTGEKLRALLAHGHDVRGIDRAFLCGPGSFIKETRNALFELGMVREHVQHEFFAGRSGGGAVASSIPATASAVAEITRAPGTIDAIAVLDGQRHRFALAPGQHVLEAVLQAGIKAPYSCTGGMCSTCRARVVEGAVTMTVNYSLEEWEIQRGFVLTCQAIVKSDILVIDYDAM